MHELTWGTRDGVVLKVSEMTQDHAYNAYNVLVKRHGELVKYTKIGAALYERAFGVSPMKEYEKSLEFKRTMAKELKNLFGNERYWED